MTTGKIEPLTFETISADQARDPLAAYETLDGASWTALLAPGVDAAQLTDEQRTRIREAALAARQEGRVLVVELAMPAGS